MSPMDLEGHNYVGGTVQYLLCLFILINPAVGFVLINADPCFMHWNLGQEDEIHSSYSS